MSDPPLSANFKGTLAYAMSRYGRALMSDLFRFGRSRGLITIRLCVNLDIGLNDRAR